MSPDERRLRAALAWVAWTMGDRIVAQLIGSGDGFTFEPGTALLWAPAVDRGVVMFRLDPPLRPFSVWGLIATITRPGHEDGDIVFGLAVPAHVIEEGMAA